MDIFERILLLKQSAVFSAVRSDDLRVLAPFLEPQEFVSGDIVFHMGEMGEYMYLIESGVVRIFMPEAGGDGIELVRMHRGDCFGEMNLLDGLPRSASAEIAEDSVLLALDKERLLGLIASNPDLALGMLRSLSVKLRGVGAMLLDKEKGKEN